MRSIKDQMDLFGNQDDIEVQEITPDGIMAGPMPDVNAPEYQQMRKAFAVDALKGAVTSPVTATADTVEMGAALPDPSPSMKLASPTYAAIEEAFDQLANLGINRANAEKLIKDTTGIELKGTAGELTGEIVGLPLAAASNAATSILKAASKYGDKAADFIGDIGEEAGELFRRASGGDGTDGMAMATAGASRETVPTGVKPDLPDTSVTPMMIGESTPRGQEAAENYNRAKELDPDLSEEDLFAQTGVYEGPDGKLRSELPTTDATINTDVFEKLKSGDTTETTLEELVDYPKLFNAYREEYYDGNKLDFVTPSDLGSIKVRLNTDDDFAGAYYSNYPNQGELIELNGKLNPDELRATLLHEVQHAIQRREGFTSGANTEMFYPTVSEDLGLGRLSKDRYLRDLERVNDTLENADAMVFKPLKNIAKTVFGGKADLNNPLRNFDFDEQYMLMEVIPDIALERHKRQKFSRFGSFTPIQTYKITKEDVAKYLQDKSNLYNFKTQYLDVPDDEILEYEVSPEVIENFVNKAGKILNNPKLTPDVLRANLHGKVNTMKELDLLRTIPSRARLEYKRKYGELEAELIEKRDARRQALRQLTDMSDSQIEEQMREEFPPLGMEIQEAIARANPQFMKGLTAKDGKVQVPPEKARLDDDSPVAFSASARPDVDETVDTMTAAGLDDASIADWRKANATSEEFRKRLKGRNTTLIDLANKLKAEDITAKEYRQVADAVRPIRVVEEVPKPATTTEVVSALGKKSEKGVVGVNRSIPEGDRITARLDINAYTDYDVWIPTLTHPEKKTMYSPTVVLRDVSFIQPDSPAVKKAMNVATGQAKAPFAVMEGNYRSMSDSDAFEYAKQAFDDESWTQVGYDPTRRGFFYDRKTGEPVLNAEEVVQVGHLVLAKNAVKGDANDFPFNKGGAVPMKKQMELFEPVTKGFDVGGMAEAQEKLDAGVDKLRTDRKAQFDKMTEMLTSGKVNDMSIEEKQNFVELYKLLKQHHSFNEGGLLQEGGSVDPVSGNEVPVGSLQKEVRDDIPAQLSEGEFVMPADVVRYHGLDKMMELRDEAKAGLARMDAMGQMGNSEEAVIPEGVPFDTGNIPFDIDDLELEDDGVQEFNVGGLAQGTQQVASGMAASPTGVLPSTNAITGAGQFAQVQSTSPYYMQQGAPQQPQQPLTAQQLLPTTELRQYINDSGQIISIAFANGQPVTPIPAGFKPYSGEAAAPAAPAPAPTAPPTSSGVSNMGDSGDEGPSPEERRRQQEYRKQVNDRMSAAESLGYTKKQSTLEALAGLAPGIGMFMPDPEAGTILPDGSIADGYGNSYDPRTGEKMGLAESLRQMFIPEDVRQREAERRKSTGMSPATQAGLRTVEGEQSIQDLLAGLPEAPKPAQQIAPLGDPYDERTAQDDIVASSFPVSRGNASISKRPTTQETTVTTDAPKMERMDAPTSPVIQNVPVEAEIATINPMGRGEQEYVKDADGSWVQISGTTGQIGRKAPALISANLNNPDSAIVSRRTEMFDVPSETGERIALPAPRPERPSRSLDLQSSFDVEAMADRDDSPARTSFDVEADADRDFSNQRAAEEKAKQDAEAAREAERFERRARTDEFNAAKRDAETASHQSRYESQGYSPSAARSAAVNKTDADNEARQQENNPRATAVTSSSGKAVRSSSGQVVTNTPPDDGGGDDGDGGDSKIVCTEMYRQTQLNDWKQAIKIWGTYEKKYLTKYHEIGYHWLFKPYVRGMQNSSMLTQLGAYLAQERTKHLKHVMTKGRAKDSLVGNVWCKIIHPIVYIAGRIKNG